RHGWLAVKTAMLTLVAPGAWATLILTSTNDIDIADQWRTTTYPHPADIDGDNVYGIGYGSNWLTGAIIDNTNSGHVMFNVGQSQVTNSIPPYNLLSNAAVYLPIYVA